MENRKKPSDLRLVSLSLHITHVPRNYFYLIEYMIVTQHSNATSTKPLIPPFMISPPQIVLTKYVSSISKALETFILA